MPQFPLLTIMESPPSHAHLPGAAAEPVACLVRELTDMEAVTCSHLVRIGFLVIHFGKNSNGSFPA